MILFKIEATVNPLFEENDKDTEIKSSSSFTLTSPEESELEAYLEIDSIPPGIDLTFPTTLEVSSSNPTSPTLTRREGFVHGNTECFASLVRLCMENDDSNCDKEKDNFLLANLLTKIKTKILLSQSTRSRERNKSKENDDKVSSDILIHTIVMPIRITFDNPIDFN
ncbi:hypothetical protein Tco_0487564 [Tanacetum coccineum]